MFKRNFLDTSSRDPKWITTVHKSEATAIRAAKRVRKQGPSIIIAPNGMHLGVVK